MRFLTVSLRIAATAALALASARCHESTTAPPGAARATTITAAEMQRWVDRLADDSMRGRGTPSAALDRAAATIAAYFRNINLQPAFPGSSFLARFPVPPVAGSADSAPNVGATLRGSNPNRADEYVVVIAHLDGKGVGSQVGMDSIYNGADDNASGTAGVLELAEAFAGMSPHPGRSLLFLVVSGEEEGYWGSQWYVDHPTVPLANIVAVVNLDMISRNSPDSAQVGGLGRSTLGDVVLQTNAAHPEEGLVLSSGPTFGSDQVPFFSTAGAPFLFFFAGLHGDYHTPRDESDRIDADKAARVARLAFHTVLAVANADARPLWLPGGRPSARVPGPIL